MALTRRSFLQHTGGWLTALGLSQSALSALTDRYQIALAQPTRRKLALLVGINQYPESVCDYTPPRGTALNGCLTDVELQRELLIHRFGFQPSDILTLTDQMATRQAIEEAFLFHLSRQAQAGDVVVFHFSGLGSRVQLGEGQALQNSLVPVDGTLPTPDSPQISDLMEATLGWLLRSLATDQVTTILDVGYTNLGRVLQGNLRVRSRPNVPIGQLLPNELALQEQLIRQTGITREQIQSQWQLGQLPGVILTATRPEQLATEAQWNDFSAGLFTQALTQQLWWSTPATTLRISLSRAVGTVKQSVGLEQEPALNGQKVANQILPAYYLSANPTVGAGRGADGIVRSLEDDGKVQVWLGGLPALVLEHYGASLLTLDGVDRAGLPVQETSPPASSAPSLLQVRSRDGLTVKARPLAAEGMPPVRPQIGQLAQEVVRVLPRNIGLTIALDANLERIERVDATSAFAAIPRVSSVIAGEQAADFLFGKIQAAPTVTASLDPSLLSVSTVPAAPPAASKTGYGLFYLGREAIPNTLIPDVEAVKTAVNRLNPQLRTLLATKWLRLTENRGSSRLGVRATLEQIAPQERLLMQQETLRAPWSLPDSKVSALVAGNGGLTLPVGSQIQYRLHNYSDRPLYFMLLGLDTNGNALALYTAPLEESDQGKSAPVDRCILPGDTLTVPQATAAFNWRLQAPGGLAETHILFSRAPFTQAYQVLEAELRSQTDVHRIAAVTNPLDLVQAMLADLHQASGAIAPKVDIPADSYALNVNAWATLSFVYQVVV